jgi:hypothetical protein
MTETANAEVIYVCNACAHTWQAPAEGVDRCENCHAVNAYENIYTFELWAADCAEDWSQRTLDAIGAGRAQ